MTMHVAILRELMVAGYEGAALLAAFERMCVIVAPAVSSPRTTVAASQSPARARRTQPEVSAVPFVPLPPPANAKAIAEKAISQAALSGSAKTVASHLMEHFNLKTGRCDPGQTRLAQKAGIDIRSVRRVVSDLVAAGLFAVVRHGGHGHRNAYLPCWPELSRLAALGENGSGQKSPAEQGKNVRQNLLRKPDSDSMVGRVPRAKRPAAPDRRQMSMVMPITGGRAKAEEAVRAKLNRQLQGHLTATHLPHDRPAFVRDMTASTSANWDAGIAAEMARAGDGLPLLLADIARVTSGRKATG